MNKARISELPEMGDCRQIQPPLPSSIDTKGSTKTLTKQSAQWYWLRYIIPKDLKTQLPLFFRGAATVNDYMFVIDTRVLPPNFPREIYIKDKRNNASRKKKSWWKLLIRIHVGWGERPVGLVLLLSLIRSSRRHDHDSIRNRESWVTPFGRGRSPAETTAHAISGHPATGWPLRTLGARWRCRCRQTAFSAPWRFAFCQTSPRFPEPWWGSCVRSFVGFGCEWECRCSHPLPHRLR